jgi:hypothetical protein
MRVSTTNRPPQTLVERIMELFRPGPLDWILGLGPRKTRFRPGPHLHGLAEHDVVAKDIERRR